ncbi:MAG: hypothetical protein IMZ58_08200 [Thermoplasmata archaeon]|nr:hypothetical protein [Thermoplasmata archaeon]
MKALLRKILFWFKCIAVRSSVYYDTSKEDVAVRCKAKFVDGILVITEIKKINRGHV